VREQAALGEPQLRRQPPDAQARKAVPARQAKGAIHDALSGLFTFAHGQERIRTVVLLVKARPLGGANYTGKAGRLGFQNPR
jgi:hypothetical protein